MTGIVALSAVSASVADEHAPTAAGGFAHHTPYSFSSAAYRARARFLVRYTGTGTYRTIYHATPPNPGGNPDTNDANDSSTQRWSLTFLHAVTLVGCGPGQRSPCPGISTLGGATGSTRVTGTVAHTHRDGLYPADNASVSCAVKATTAPHAHLGTTLSLRYSKARHAVAITALLPVSEALTLLPQQCPGQGDSIDGLYDNYFMPGFSFASGYGPERWFRSGTVLVPLAVLHRASRITIHFALEPAGAPPEHCAVPRPSYQRCTTGGSWRGTLLLRRTS